jgi:phosphopantetheinyl transferase
MCLQVHPDLGFDFNISHDGIYILLAVTHQVGARVGVDVTKIYAPVDALEIEEALQDQVSSAFGNQ